MLCRSPRSLAPPYDPPARPHPAPPLPAPLPTRPAGIEDGGRTGLTAIVVSFLFFVALFFSPILASIPPYATGPALVLVGGSRLVFPSRTALPAALSPSLSQQDQLPPARATVTCRF